MMVSGFFVLWTFILYFLTGDKTLTVLSLPAKIQYAEGKRTP